MGKKDFFGNMEEKIHSQLLDTVGRSTGNAFLFKGGPRIYDEP